MATSGSYSFAVTRNDIIRDAYLLIKAVDALATIPSVMMTDGVRRLDAMLDRWRKTGVHVWKLEEITLFPDPNQRRYNLSLSSPDNVAFAYYQTTLATAAAAGATTVNVAAASNLRAGDPLGVISVGDQFGVMLDSGTISWGVVSGVSGTSVTFAPGLGGTTAIGRQAWNYHSTTTCAVPRPVGIGRGNGSVRRHDFTSLIDTPIGPCLSRLDYDALPNKDQALGSTAVTQAYYDLQLSAGFLSLWQVPAAPILNLIKLTAQIPIQDFVNSTDNPDLPNEWVDAITYNLALVMAPQFDVPESDFQRILLMATGFMMDAATEDREGESIFFQPDRGP